MSLIELIIVLVILGILAVIAIFGLGILGPKSKLRTLELGAESFATELEAVGLRRRIDDMQAASLIWTIATRGDLPPDVSVAVEGAAADSVVLLQDELGVKTVVSDMSEIKSKVAYVSFARSGVSVCLYVPQVSYRYIGQDGFSPVIVGRNDDGLDACELSGISPAPQGASIGAWSSLLAP